MTKRVALTVRLPPALAQRLRAESEESGVPINTIVLRMIEERLNAESS